MKDVVGILCLVTCFWSCDNDDSISQEDLNEQFLQIKNLAESEICEDSSEWRFIEVGFKACGGPEGHIAYSTRIDTLRFVEMVKGYNKAKRQYAIEENLFSNCLFVSPPAGINCVNGEAVLVYSLCDLEPDGGLCNAAIPRYYFDKEEQKCKEFIWGGCDGTVPFETLEECRACERGS
jgi:hypothetical protein